MEVSTLFSCNSVKFGKFENQSSVGFCILVRCPFFIHAWMDSTLFLVHSPHHFEWIDCGPCHSHVFCTGGNSLHRWFHLVLFPSTRMDLRLHPRVPDAIHHRCSSHNFLAMVGGIQEETGSFLPWNLPFHREVPTWSRFEGPSSPLGWTDR